MAGNIYKVVEIDTEDFSNEEFKQAKDSERAFFTTFGFSLPPKARQSVLCSKHNLNLTTQDITQLYKAGLLHCPSFEEPYLRLRKRDFAAAIMETLLTPGIFLVVAFVIYGKAASQGSISLTVLFTVGALSTCGFSLFYYLFQQKIRPFFTLLRTGLKFGEQYPARR